MRKLIYLVLDLLLILGSLACVATIDGGEWWIDGMTSFVAIQVKLAETYLMPDADNAGEADRPEGNSTPASGAGVTPLTGNAIWEDASSNLHDAVDKTRRSPSRTADHKR